MSRQNVEVIERMLRDAPGDPAALRDILAEDVRWDPRALDIPDYGEPVTGRDAVMEFFRRWVGTFDEWGYEAVQVIDAGDSVAVHVHQWGRGRGSGVRVEQEFWQVWTLRDGKVVSAVHHPRREDALAVIGRPVGKPGAASSENVEAIRRMYHAWLGGDDEAVFETFAPDIRLNPDPEAYWVGFGDQYVGHDGVRRYMRAVYEAFEHYRPEVERIVDAGENRVLTLAVEHGRGRASGVEVEARETAHLWTLRDGKAVQLDLFLDRRRALEAVGLREPGS